MTSPHTETQAPPLARHLANSDKFVRQKAINGLHRFFSASSTPSHPAPSSSSSPILSWSTSWQAPARLAPRELFKLSRGIFYAFWMSDKPRVQQALADSLAELVLVIRSGRLPPEGCSEEEDRDRCAILFLESFWKTMVGEWSKIDALRMDKFYLLLRRFIGSSFALLIRSNPPFSPPLFGAYNSILASHPLAVETSKTPVSIIFHLCSLYLEELAGALVSESTPAETTVPIIEVLRPWVRALAVTCNKKVHERVASDVFDPLLEACDSTDPNAGTGPLVGEDGKVDDEDLTIIVRRARIGADEGVAPPAVVKAAILQAIFDEAARSDTTDVNRRRMYTYVRSRGHQ